MEFPKRIRLPDDAYDNPSHVFHVVIHALPEDSPFAAPLLGNAIWALVADERARNSVSLIAACLMPDHLHLLCSPRERTVVRWVAGFKSYSTRVSWDHRERKGLWQPGFYDRRLRSLDDLEVAIAYVEQNPVREGLVGSLDEWPWVGVWESTR